MDNWKENKEGRKENGGEGETEGLVGKVKEKEGKDRREEAKGWTTGRVKRREKKGKDKGKQTIGEGEIVWKEVTKKKEKKNGRGSRGMDDWKGEGNENRKKPGKKNMIRDSDVELTEEVNKERKE